MLQTYLTLPLFPFLALKRKNGVKTDAGDESNVATTCQR